ncbi:MAG: hypothetical protein QNJ23_05815 [Woeseiaceae bacterium]|nr:hypothetical protein [Woeseiaceae bacterium]
MTVADVQRSSIEALLDRFGLFLCLQEDGEAITGSFWGDREAGVVGTRVFVRNDTPLHSLLHETCHVICMSADRRARLDTDAGGGDLEEAAVCYLQVVLADDIDGCGRDRLMADMDAWGYSFRLGDTRSWFENDAEDAHKWLIDNDLLDDEGTPRYRLRA